MSKFITGSENLVKSLEEVLCKMMMYAMQFLLSPLIIWRINFFFGGVFLRSFTFEFDWQKRLCVSKKRGQRWAESWKLSNKYNKMSGWTVQIYSKLPQSVSFTEHFTNFKRAVLALQPTAFLFWFTLSLLIYKPTIYSVPNGGYEAKLVTSSWK